MSRSLWCVLLLLMSFHGAIFRRVRAAEPVEPKRSLVLVRGASGTAEYGPQFDVWSDRWIEAARRGGLSVKRIGPLEKSTQTETDNAADRTALKALLEAATDEQVSELWLVLIGHGTFDGKTARFNLRGDDVSASELAMWLGQRKSRTVVVNAASASAPFLDTLRAPERIVVTATKSGAEQNFARFGDFLSSAIGNAAHDLDKDGQTSLFEAFLVASRQTEDFYESDGRLPTEHALLDDNSDGAGIRATWFRGLRLIQKPDHGHPADGALAHQTVLVLSAADQKLAPAVRQERDALLRAIAALRAKKAEYTQIDEYFAELEKLCLQLAKIEAKVAPAAERTGP